ncbi:hypothetical protein B0H10DRAFT_2294952 [Mycena sp. CBHHK59/15]|nr:hypothetical protein B0H10DRAFT_2294952 [Mycena sp. CBHHK59/15]
MAEPKPSQETASLVKRLAGPSTGKAGLAKDQADINRIIADASKGSKFYENEKRKDKELTRRIDQILQLRDELTNRVDMRKIEASVDQILNKLESQRDLSQTIVHFDLDSFFASVEVLNDPTLVGKPFAVGHTVLSTASYEARKYGVRSGMASHIAKKLCPELIIVSHGFSGYTDMSRKVMDICRRYDPQMCPAGCDEGYLNITAYCESNSISADDFHAETRLTVSAGIAPNTAIIAFMHDLSIRKVPGIGRVSERLLESIGVKTCGDIFIYRATLSLLDKQFGLMHLLRTHLGIASNSVQPPQREERKSIGAERTFQPLGDEEKILGKLREVCAELESDMEETGFTGRTITLKYKLDNFEVFTRSRSSDRWISKKEDLFTFGQELLLPELPLTIRLIGLRVTKLKDLRDPNQSIGIKRFFDPASSSSPQKKRKIDVSEPELGQAQDSDGQSAIQEAPQHEPSGIQDLADSATPAPPSSRSTTGGQSTLPFQFQPESAKPSSSSKPNVRQPPVVKEKYVCPVCERQVAKGNDAINSHLDSCLSREAIRKAQAEPVTPPKQEDVWERWTKTAAGSKKTARKR